MAWAFPCAVGFIPPDDAAHMAADRRQCMHDSLLVPEGSHAFAVDLQDRRLAAAERVERFRLWFRATASARGGAIRGPATIPNTSPFCLRMEWLGCSALIYISAR